MSHCNFSLSIYSTVMLVCVCVMKLCASLAISGLLMELLREVVVLKSA